MLTTKKREEELVTAFVLRTLNERNGTAYRAEAVQSEHTPVDTRGVSDAPEEEPIDFQVTYADNGLPHQGGAVLGKKFRASAISVVDLTTPYDIAAAIERKQSRYTAKEAARLVLLIWKTKSCIVAPKGVHWNVHDIAFKACYFACLPGSGTPGQVIAIKPLVTRNGKHLSA